MRQLFSRLAVAPGLLALACATAIEEGGFGAPLDTEEGGSSAGGSLTVSGSGGGYDSAGSTSMSNGGKAGSTSNAFGGTATGGGAGKAGSASGGNGGSASGGSATAGSSAGGKGGASNAGSANGGSNTAGTASGGSGSAGGPTSTVCDGVPDWTSKTFKVGDTVASTCSGPFAGSCGTGQSHKFECNPMAGMIALPWCMSREPGIGNGWQEAWVDKGQCQ